MLVARCDTICARERLQQIDAAKGNPTAIVSLASGDAAQQRALSQAAFTDKSDDLGIVRRAPGACPQLARPGMLARPSWNEDDLLQNSYYAGGLVVHLPGARLSA